jgi:hypothetical protein
VTELNLWVFVHLLLFVYWLGGDLGVFVLARTARRSDLGFAERLLALKQATVIDFVPRLCFALMFTVGLQVVSAGGYAVVPVWVHALAWAVSAAWIALLIALGRYEGKPLADTLNRVHLGFQALMLVVIVGVGAASIAGLGPLPGGWLAAKVLLFGLIFACGIGIDFAFRPIGPAFVRLATEGSKPDIEAAIGSAVDGAIRFVLALYALIVVIAFLGVTKFF